MASRGQTIFVLIVAGFAGIAFLVAMKSSLDYQAPPDQAQSDSAQTSDSAGQPADGPVAEETVPIPSDLQAFNKLNADAAKNYGEADNELKKSVVRKARDDDVIAAFPNGAFSVWPGVLTTLKTDGDGDAFIAVTPEGCTCTLETTNNALSESIGETEGQATLIKSGSPLFRKLEQMHEGDRVVVSGRFFREDSLTEGGSMSAPAWLASFSDVEPENQGSSNGSSD